MDDPITHAFVIGAVFGFFVAIGVALIAAHVVEDRSERRG